MVFAHKWYSPINGIASRWNKWFEGVEKLEILENESKTSQELDIQLRAYQEGKAKYHNATIELADQ